jgi:hypothetical protein
MNIAPKKIILSLLAIALSFSVYAQGPDVPPPPPTPTGPGYPIDGNILLLLIAGIMYGVYILKKFRFQTK